MHKENRTLSFSKLTVADTVAAWEPLLFLFPNRTPGFLFSFLFNLYSFAPSLKKLHVIDPADYAADHYLGDTGAQDAVLASLGGAVVKQASLYYFVCVQCLPLWVPSRNCERTEQTHGRDDTGAAWAACLQTSSYVMEHTANFFKPVESVFSITYNWEHRDYSHTVRGFRMRICPLKLGS